MKAIKHSSEEEANAMAAPAASLNTLWRAVHTVWDGRGLVDFTFAIIWNIYT